MINNKNILIINGNRSANSIWSALISSEISKYLNEQQYTTDIVNVSGIDMPIFQKELLYVFNSDIEDVKNKIHNSVGIVFVFPEYHGTIPAALKNILEYLSNTILNNKPCFVCCHSGGRNSMTSIFNMHVIITKLGGWLCPRSFCIDNTLGRNQLTDIELESLKERLFNSYLSFLKDKL